MDYIILNNDGSLQKQSLTRYINQGSHGVDKIFIGWSNGLATDILQVVFTLPNQTTNTVLGEFESNYNYDGEHTINGWVITLTNAQTTYNGLLLASARIIRSGIVQVACPFTLVINETGVMPDTDSGLTIAQIDSYLLNIQNLVTSAVRQNTDAALSPTSENPVQNKVVTNAIETLKRGSYTKVDTTEYPTLADFLATTGEEGYLYLYPVNISDEDEGYYQYIWENDLWIPLGTTKIDIANMMTTDTDQDVSATKTFDNLKDVRFKAVNEGHYFYIRANGNVFHIGAYGVATSLTLDNYLTKFIPAATGQQELGSNDNKWKTLYLSHYVAWGNNVLIGKDGSNRFYVTGRDGNTKIKVDVNETYFAQHVEPDSPNTYDLGRTGMNWNYAYVNYISNGTTVIPVNAIATKVDTNDVLDLGTFDSNGEITIAISDLADELYNKHWGTELHDMYIFTYSYAQAIIYLDKTQLETAGNDGIAVRTAMPVVYNLTGSAEPGNLIIKKVGSNYVFKVSNGIQKAAATLHLYMIKTGLIS